MLWPVLLRAEQDFFVVLQYHHVSNDAPASTSVRIEQFEQHLSYLADNGFHVLALDDALQAVQQGKPLPNFSVAITFDDSYRSIYEHAYPRLKQRGWPFTVFVNTAPMAEQQPWAIRWEELLEMQANGGLIANHSVSHPHFPRREATDWKPWAREEIRQAGNTIQRHLGNRPTLFAWPYGEYNPMSQSLLQELELTGFGQHAGAVSRYEDFTALPRFAVNQRYANLDTLADKLRAKPMPVQDIHPDNFVLSADNRQPRLDVSMAEEAPPGGWQHALQCFVSGQGMVSPTWLNPNSFRLQAPASLRPGRSRYTCTARDSDGRYFWFSRQWLLPNTDGTWPKE
jgi:peptidoglycan/xylan/chitin deacetylase (PgdA/CDA1 family)